MGALMIELLGKSLVELQALFEEHKIQKFRAKQLIDYIYHRHIFVFQDMTQFPKTLRDWLDSNCIVLNLYHLTEKHRNYYWNLLITAELKPF